MNQVNQENTMKNVYKVNQGNPIFMEKLPQNVNSEGTNWKGRRREGGCVCNKWEGNKEAAAPHSSLLLKKIPQEREIPEEVRRRRAARCFRAKILRPSYGGQNFKVEIPEEVRGRRRMRAARCWRSRRLPNTVRPANEQPMSDFFISHF